MKGLKGEIDQRPRRFYERAQAVPLDAGWGVALDGKELRTPAKRNLVLPTGELASVIADEWHRQEDRIDLATMHLTRLANVAIDRAPETRVELADEAARYAETDLVCHFAERPAALRRRQEAGWTPLRDWAAAELGVVLKPVTGIIAIPQPPASIEAVRRHAASLDDFRLTALIHSIALFGSAVVGLAVERRRITAVEGHEVSRIDEAFQAGQWGEDAEAVRRRNWIQAEAIALDLWFDALGG